MHSLKKGFTLVELIVVITILAILWTIAFISLQWYAANARDSVRIQDIANIKKSMELFVTESWLYPNPSDSVDITYSWWIVWSQWTVWDSVVENLWKLNKKPVDPVLATEYSYSRTNNKTEYELSGILEWWWVVNNTTINQTHAATQYRALVWWNYNGQVLKVSTWWLDYLLALPSITTTDTATTDIVTTTTNKSLVYNGEYNLPSNYSWVEWFTTTWWFEYAPSDIVAFSWPREELELASGKIKFIRNLQTAYSWSILSLKSEFTELLSFDAQTDVDTAREIALWMFQNVPQFNKNLQSTTFEPSFVWWLQLWLDADADYTITKDGSNKVSQWNDKSGNENHIEQTVWSKMPTWLKNGMNGNPTVDFNRTTWDEMAWVKDITLGDKTFFVVFNIQRGFPIPSNDVNWLMAHAGSFNITAANSNAGVSTVDVNNPRFSLSQAGSSSLKMSLNNSEIPNTEIISTNTNYIWSISNGWATVTNSFAIWWVNGTGFGTHDWGISEILVYDRILTITEKNKINAYLANKWWIDVPPFNPSSLSWLELWLDANDASTITKDGSNKVSAWNDKSGNGNNAGQGTPAAQPTYDATGFITKPTVTFNGVNDFVDLDSMINTTDFTVFAVLEIPTEITSATTTNTLIGPLTSANPWGGIAFGTISWTIADEVVSMLGLNPSPQFAYSQANIPAGNSVMEFYLNGTTEEILINDYQLSLLDGWGGLDSSTHTLKKLQRIGGARDSYIQHFDGSISEMVIFSRALSADERSAIKNYLSNKWGI